jgi:FxsA cytoplasmic membrane protein.
MRILAFIGALGLLIPGTITDLGGIAVLVLIYIVQTAKAKRMRAAGIPLSEADKKEAQTAAEKS